MLKHSILNIKLPQYIVEGKVYWGILNMPVISRSFDNDSFGGIIIIWRNPVQESARFKRKQTNS